jgi:hypothetical protein
MRLPTHTQTLVRRVFEGTSTPALETSRHPRTVYGELCYARSDLWLHTTPYASVRLRVGRTWHSQVQPSQAHIQGDETLRSHARHVRDEHTHTGGRERRTRATTRTHSSAVRGSCRLLLALLHATYSGAPFPAARASTPCGDTDTRCTHTLRYAHTRLRFTGSTGRPACYESPLLLLVCRCTDAGLL